MKTTQQLTAAAVCDLIRDLARLYVGDPQAVEVKAQEATDGSAYFGLRGAPEDDSRLIGREGCHVDAMEQLVTAVGEANRRIFTFRLITNPDDLGSWLPPKAALDFDPRPTRDVLCRWLDALGLDKFSIEANPGAGPRDLLSFNFIVAIADREQAEALAAGGEESLFAALGTLVRATGKQHGVRLQLLLENK